ncbi:MAG: hypothetical protein HFE66_03925 [Clostridiales bacterium]|jgi:hypothetical protein|nr:hypothetical protein [Clostridiales bacterium]
MNTEYFCCYHSYLKKIAKLSDQEVGRLFRSLLQYSSTGEAQELAGRESIAFDFIADDIDRAKKNYLQKCEKNRENALARATERKRTQANGSERKRTGGIVEDKYKDKEKDKINTPHTPQGADDARETIKKRFDLFWKAYPKKTGKGNAEKSWNRIRPGKALFDQIMEALQKAVQCEQWLRDNGRYIPNPSTWLNQKRWEDEYVFPSQCDGYSYDDTEEECPYG